MKINNIIPPINNLNRQTKTRNNANKSIPSNIQARPRYKELSSAFILLQTAQGIIQQALNVSNKLQTMAIQTMQTGNTNMSEIQNALSGISESIKNYGGNITPPPVNLKNLTGNNIPEMPGSEVNQMQAIVKSKTFDSKELTDIENKLNRKKETVEQGFVFLSEKLKKHNSSINFKNFDFPKSIANDIVKASGLSLAVQGNLNNERVVELLNR